jgi:crotonobetainyl-CoA:carnitine CoA-transferase CaiB-like acyl-CoA transferase
MYAFQGAVRRRYYSRHIFGYPNDIVGCADGHVVMIPGATGFPTPLTRDTLSPMALLFENPDLNAHELFVNAGERMIRWREFDALIEEYLATHTAMEIVMTAQALRMPFAFVPSAGDLLADDHLAERGFFHKVAHGKAGTLNLPGPPFKMSETPLTVAPAPERGQANAAVYTEELGYKTADVGMMSDRDVI